MPGLMKTANPQSQMQGPAQPGRGQAQQPRQQQAGGAPPEEQELYNATVGQAYNLIYDDKVMPRVLNRLSASDPVDGLAATTVMVMDRVEDSAEKQGVKIPGDVMLHAGMEVMGDLAGLAKDARIHEYDKAEKEAALYQALDQYRQMRDGQGRLDKQAIRQDWDMLMQAEQEGRLEDVLPGAGRLAERAQARRDAGSRAQQAGPMGGQQQRGMR